MEAAARGEPAAVVFATADVRACYPSIDPGTVSTILGPAADDVVGLLRRFAGGGVRGLPVGPEPSAVVANALLALLDETLRREGVRHVRWVDDLVLWGSRREIVRALAALHRAAATVGLELNGAKTGLLAEREELTLVAPGGRHSSIIRAP